MENNNDTDVFLKELDEEFDDIQEQLFNEDDEEEISQQDGGSDASS